MHLLFDLEPFLCDERVSFVKACEVRIFTRAFIFKNSLVLTLFFDNCNCYMQLHLKFLLLSSPLDSFLLTSCNQFKDETFSKTFVLSVESGLCFSDGKFHSFFCFFVDVECCRSLTSFPFVAVHKFQRCVGLV